MIPLQIRMRQFKCFSDETVFHYPTEPGLYLVQGRNEVRPELEGNGCGKSTLFADAVTWCLYGKTPRLLKAGDIVAWDAGSGALVEFEFSVRGKVYRLLRTQSPNTLQLTDDGNKRVVEQVDVDRLLGMDFSAFTSSVVFPQFGTMFFDLGPADKSSLLSNILDLSVWDQASDQAKKSTESIQSTIQVTRERIAKNEGLVAGWLARDLAASIAEWEEQQAGKHAKLQKTQEEHEQEMEKIRRAGVKVEKKLEGSNNSVSEVAEMELEVKEELEKRLKIEEEWRFRCQTLQTQVDSLLKEIKKFQNVADECPYCRQKVEKAHIDAELAELRENLAEIEEKKEKSAKKVAEMLGQVKQIKEDLDLLRSTSKELQAEQRSILEERSQLKSQAAKIMGFLKRLQEEQAALHSAVNPYLEEQRKQQEMVQKLEDFLATDAKDLKDLDKKLFSTQYWIKAFKEVRLSLIGEVLVQLELEVNNKLFQLGLSDWKVDFAVEGVTKGGKVRKGFTVTISTPQNLEPVPWSAWSGGETQRLRLAGALGLADLVAAKSGQHVGFEVYDEPSQYLSTAGIESLLSVLRERATAMGKMIFLIDHRHLDSAAFAGIYTVTKSSDMVRVAMAG